MTVCLLLKFAKYCPSRNINIQIFSDKKLETSKFWTFWNFPVTLYCNADEKSITIHVSILDPSFRYCGMRILWSFQGLRLLDPRPGLCDGPAGYMFQTKKRKTSTTGDPTDQVASQKPHCHHDTGQ